jgi:CRP-like cAMP-binding protein
MFTKADIVTTLQSIPCFLDLKPNQLEKLADIVSVHQLDKGECLFNEGDRTDTLFILLDGQVCVTHHIPAHGDLITYIAEPLDFIGWSSLTPVVRQRTGSTCATEPSRLLAFNTDTLMHLCEEDHDIGFVVMRRIANVVASRMLTMRLQLLDIIVQSGK